MFFKRNFIFILLLILSSIYGRSLSEIKKSGYIVYAIREKPTIYYTNSDGKLAGLHYELAMQFAKSIKVDARFKIVKINDYYNLINVDNSPYLMKSVDVFADSLTITYNRRIHTAFIPLYNIVEVLLYREDLPIYNLNDLLKYKSSIAKGSSYEKIIFNIQKDLHSNLNINYIDNTSQQIDDLINSNSEYTILDSDQAVFYKNKYDSLEIESTILKDTARLNHIGWACHYGNKSLLKSLQSFIKKVKKKGTFDQLWRKNYFLSFKKYGHFLELIDQTGTDLFKTSLDLAVMRKYEKSMDLFQKARDMKFISEDMQKLYDRLYLSWLKDEFNKFEGNPEKIVDKYLQKEPSDFFIKELSKEYPQIYDRYTDMLEEKRLDAEDNEDLETAIKNQELLTYLKPRSFEERNTLKRLRKQYVTMIEIEHEEAIRTNIAVVSNINEALETITLNTEEIKTVIETNISKVEKQKIEELKKKVKTVADAQKIEGEKYFKTAMTFFKQSDYTNARNNFNNSIILGYNSKTSQNYIARINNIIDARIRAEEKRKLKLFDKYFNLALTAFSKEDYQTAMDNILLALELFPNNRLAKKYQRLIGENLKFQGDNVIDVTSPYYDYFKAKIFKIEKLMNENSLEAYKKAKAICEDILNYFPHNEKTRELLLTCEYKINPEEFKVILMTYFANGKMYLESKQKTKALRIFKLVKKMDSRFPNINSFIRKASPKKVVEATTVVATDDNGKKKTYDVNKENDKALALWRSGKHKKALVAYDNILRLFPNNVQAMLNKGRLENEIMSKKGTRPKKVNSAARKRAEKFYLTGQFYYRIRDYQKAIEQWKLAYKVDPTFRQALIDIKRISLLLKK